MKKKNMTIFWHRFFTRCFRLTLVRACNSKPKQSLLASTLLIHDLLISKWRNYKTNVRWFDDKRPTSTSSKNVEIAIYLVVCIFKEGCTRKYVYGKLWNLMEFKICWQYRIQWSWVWWNLKFAGNLEVSFTIRKFEIPILLAL